MATRNFVPRADGEGSLGTSAKKWGDVQAVKATIANVTGKATEAGTADTATKLATAHTIALSGDATGSATFDGSGDATIAAEVSKIGGTAISDFIKTLLDDGDAATARATLEANAQNCGGIVAASLGTNGYAKFANGLMLQWGYCRASGTTHTLNFPISFPNMRFIGIAQIAQPNDKVYCYFDPNEGTRETAPIINNASGGYFWWFATGD